ncbi:MAG: methyltransferase domain-containing protein [archaeon]
MDFLTNFERTYELMSDVPQFKETWRVSDYLDFYSKAKKRARINKKYLEILDIGGAEGNLAIELAQQGHSVTCLEISRKNLLKTNELAKENSVSVKCIAGDIEQRPPLGNLTASF